MLVLSRKLGEKIMIGDDIVLTIVKLDRNQVRLGIEAPVDIPIYREEVTSNPTPTIQPPEQPEVTNQRNGPLPIKRTAS